MDGTLSNVYGKSAKKKKEEERIKLNFIRTSSYGLMLRISEVPQFPQRSMNT
jgi:hypothetical protein